MNHAEPMTEDVQGFWDKHAAMFDEEADHGLHDPAVRAAWAALLVPLLPPPPAAVADMGCGTGSLAVLLAEAGHHVLGLDVSHRMLDVARAKADAAGIVVQLQQGDAAAPDLEAASYDVVLARHVLWSLPEPDDALARWVRLLKPGGRLLLVEGRWSTGSGIIAADCRNLVLRHRQQASIQRLEDPALWGRRVVDERYLLSSLA